jgi:hypothetical protein
MISPPTSALEAFTSTPSTLKSAAMSTMSPSQPSPTPSSRPLPQGSTTSSSSPLRAPHTQSPTVRSCVPAGHPWVSPTCPSRGPGTSRSTTSSALLPPASSPPPRQPVRPGLSRTPPIAATPPHPLTGSSIAITRHFGYIRTFPQPSAPRTPSCAPSHSARSNPHSRSGPQSPIHHPFLPSSASSTSTRASTAAHSILLGLTASLQTAAVSLPPLPPIPLL